MLWLMMALCRFRLLKSGARARLLRRLMSRRVSRRGSPHTETPPPPGAAAVVQGLSPPPPPPSRAGSPWRRRGAPGCSGARGGRPGSRVACRAMTSNAGRISQSSGRLVGPAQRGRIWETSRGLRIRKSARCWCWWLGGDDSDG